MDKVFKFGHIVHIFFVDFNDCILLCMLEIIKVLFLKTRNNNGGSLNFNWIC